MVKRYNNWCCTTHGHTMSESPVGLYVLASDYDALAAGAVATARELFEAQETIEGMQARLDALAAERDALRKDAERYRFLRDGEWSRARTPDVYEALIHAQDGLNDAIDAFLPPYNDKIP